MLFEQKCLEKTKDNTGDKNKDTGGNFTSHIYSYSKQKTQPNC